jgi:hypothetical protein
MAWKHAFELSSIAQMVIEHPKLGHKALIDNHYYFLTGEPETEIIK